MVTDGSEHTVEAHHRRLGINVAGAFIPTRIANIADADQTWIAAAMTRV